MKISCFLLTAAFSAFLLTGVSQTISAQSAKDPLKEGERLFRLDKTEEAVPFLQKASSSGSAPQAFNYLGLCYHKNGELKLALDVFTRAIDIPGTDKKILSFNAGNVCFDLMDYESAEKWFDSVLAIDPEYAAAYLNRANSRLNTGKIRESRDDYKKYLELCPEDEQKEQINLLLTVIEEEIVRLELEEMEKLSQEQRLKEEEERLAAKKAEEEALAAEKRRKLLEQMAAAIQEAENKAK
ncbi:tetratricopeptide repeat protein [Treponema sp.]|uniref:tetratricopeptide repeat protein n=1 Tax=Treponema sp. TaxID=166 RepID=UPI0025E60D23|nr:tetratricopeptide repeat protein [Treponema sp.]MCR5219157.1 tetratricopeptide repeat protein [Treponema sp.]